GRLRDPPGCDALRARRTAAIAPAAQRPCRRGGGRCAERRRPRDGDLDARFLRRRHLPSPLAEGAAGGSRSRCAGRPHAVHRPAPGPLRSPGCPRAPSSGHAADRELAAMSGWETLLERPLARVRRRGRFLVMDLLERHRVLSTSARSGGQCDHLRHLVNHQSCEGTGHAERYRAITERGQEGYHDSVCAELGLAADETALMGTAANMNYAVVASEREEALEVTAVVTAGVQTNAACAGDPASWREGARGMEVIPAGAGTINTI